MRVWPKVLIYFHEILFLNYINFRFEEILFWLFVDPVHCEYCFLKSALKVLFLVVLEQDFQTWHW